MAVKLTDTELITQVKRLRGYPRFIEFADELQRVLAREAQSYDHAERIITRIIDSRRPTGEGFISCPTPAELSDACAEVGAIQGAIKSPDKTCSICGGSGWKVIERRGHSGACPCPCRNGGRSERSDVTSRMLGERE